MLADAVVTESVEGGSLPQILAQAQAMGRPVVATDVDGAAEFVAAGENAWLVPPNDLAALARALDEALSLDPTARAALAERAMRHARERSSRERSCAATLAVYEELLFPPERLDRVA
jgi:glycosyltransferase involved in cell wall biosynthesis